MIKTILIFSASFFSSVALAQLNCLEPSTLPKNYTCAVLGGDEKQTLINCDKAITTPEIEQCAESQMQRTEDKLNNIYKKEMKFYQQPDDEDMKYSEMKKALLEAQRAWIKFREADCQFVDISYQGGREHNIGYINCLESHALYRIKQLQRADR